MLRSILSVFALLTLFAGTATAQIRTAETLEAEASAPDPAGICLVQEAEPVEVTINGQAYSCLPSETALRGWCRPNCDQMHCCSTNNCRIGDTMQHGGDTLTCRATNRDGAPI